MKKRVVYDNEKILSIHDNDTSFTYTAENVICGEVKQIGISLRTIGVDTSMLEEYELGLIKESTDTENIIEIW